MRITVWGHTELWVDAGYQSPDEMGGSLYRECQRMIINLKYQNLLNHIFIPKSGMREDYGEKVVIEREHSVYAFSDSECGLVECIVSGSHNVAS